MTHYASFNTVGEFTNDLTELIKISNENY